MTREEFESVQAAHVGSGLPLKAYLMELGIPYTTYHYWSKKIKSEQESHPIAPITLRTSGSDEASTGSDSTLGSPQGVMVAFPNGLRAHFGKGSEGVLMELFTQSLSGHVLP